MFVRVTEDRPGLKKGDKVQVLTCRHNITFVGIPHIYGSYLSGKWLEPLKKDNELVVLDPGYSALKNDVLPLLGITAAIVLFAITLAHIL